MPFAPVVETARLTLRPPVAADRDHGLPCTGTRGPTGTLRTRWRRPTRRPRSSSRRRESTGTSADSASGWRSDRESGDVVGVCGLKEISGDAPSSTSTTAWASTTWVEGLGKEMSRTSAAHAVEFLPELPVRALVKEINTPSVKTALGSGFERVGTRVLLDDLPDEPPSTIFEAPRIESVTSFDDATREQILDLWMRTNDAGGAVGFTPGAPRADVDARLVRGRARHGRRHESRCRPTLRRRQPCPGTRLPLGGPQSHSLARPLGLHRHDRPRRPRPQPRPPPHGRNPPRGPQPRRRDPLPRRPQRHRHDASSTRPAATTSPAESSAPSASPPATSATTSP